MPMKRTLAAAAFLAASALSAAEAPLADAKTINDALSPGVNYGNVFEANPPEGWGVKAKLTDFKLMADGGFKSVRMPVRWSAKAMATAPYTLDPEFTKQIDAHVNAALSAGLYVILNFHHYDEIFQQPIQHKERFLKLWEQVAQRYSKHPRKLIFEILNEPHDKLTPKLWNEFHFAALEVIRKSNPDRVVEVGSAGWGGTEALKELVLPRKDKNIIFTFHHYSPFHFTHQGAEWVGEQSKAWLGKKWGGDASEVREIEKEFKAIKEFNRRYDFPVNVGEFGAYSKADMESRVKWTAAMTALCKKYGYSRHYWEFKAGGFGVYDETAGKYREELRKAIVD